jgi:purine-cytosine permease-like protein
MNILFNAAKNKKILLAIYSLIGLNALWFALKGAMVHIDPLENILDLRLFYSVNDVQLYFNSLGESGRSNYVFVTKYVDSVFPVLYGTLLVLQMAGIIGKFFNKNIALLFLCLLPIIGLVLFDFLENTNTRNLLHSYPNLSEELVKKGELFTQIKWAFGACAITLLVLLSIIGKQKKHNS